MSTDDPKNAEGSASGTPEPKFINLNVHKAGLDGLDQAQINHIIQEASKGSSFYSFQQKRQKRIDSQIRQLRTKLNSIPETERRQAMQKADALIGELERHRVLNRIIVHFDMDMFFAAVEIKKNPSLADKPMAVGSMSIISTSNYIARRYGVRSAMAGFIAKKLCPQLVLIKPNFKSYQEESENVMNIIAQYDSNLSSMSLDEVYVDLTDYVFAIYSMEKNVPEEELSAMEELSDDIWQLANRIVEEIRTRVHRETKLTVSAGISCNTKLAKVCTDINKPNGQFLLKGDRKLIMDFVAKTEVRKFTGIGPVTGQILAAFNVKNGADIYAERSLLQCLFSELNVKFYFKIYLGIGSSHLAGDDGYVQKSHSRERTVGEMSDYNDMCRLLKDIAGRLSKDLRNECQMCRTVTLKLKRTSFEVSIKCRTIDQYTDDERTLWNVGKELLAQEMAKTPANNKYRLIGLKASNLRNATDDGGSKTTPCGVPNNQSTLTKFFRPQPANPGEVSSSKADRPSTSQEFERPPPNECILCEQTFDEPFEFELHRTFCDGDFSLTEVKTDSWPVMAAENSCDLINREPATAAELPVTTDQTQYLKCPICGLNTLFTDNDDLNRHIDMCLNRELCVELTRVSTSQNCNISSTETPKKMKKSGSTAATTGNKRRRLTIQPNNKNGPDLSADRCNQMKIDRYFQ